MTVTTFPTPEQRAEFEAAVLAVRDRLGDLGASADDAPADAFAVDFCTTVLGEPYFCGTGWLASREEAEQVAALGIALLTRLGLVALDLGVAEVITSYEPEEEAQAFGYIISREIDRHGEPVVEEITYGDACYVAGVGLGLDELPAALRG